MFLLLSCLCLELLSSLCFHKVKGESYSNTVEIFKDKLASSSYNPRIRPVVNQSAVLVVHVAFELVSIVELNDVQQSFTCNGFLVLRWTDENLVWDPAQYGGQAVIHPVPQDIWRPRVVVMNTLGDRDPFADDFSPIFLTSQGHVTWVPGSLFLTSCELDLTNYPFDTQVCTIKIVAMTVTLDEMQFQVYSNKVDTNFFTTNGQWDLIDTSINTSSLYAESISMSSFEMRLVMKRRSTFLLIDIILPVVFLSFLNLMVFVIPEDSGEKIGYGITVLLALTVYMSIVSSMLPNSS
ncbi:acetylcholine receptor subunit beta-like 1, partial [Physella acuta]|uniref:acetylcholine receptor subunit beta-like 1 n=1 Tax=Physella acuta TaxID=109671 RepID=UPI0027DE8A78